MSATDFFDSNVLLYLVSSDSVKADHVEGILSTGGTVSVQVLDEVASVATRKFGQSMQDVRQLLLMIRKVCAVAVADLATHELGLDLAERYKFSVYDAMLLAAAQSANCTTFFSEDLHHGQKVGGLTVRNPFRA